MNIRTANRIKIYTFRVFFYTLIMLLMGVGGGLVGLVCSYGNYAETVDMNTVGFYGDRINIYDNQNNIIKTYREYNNTKYMTMSDLNRDYVNLFLSIEDKRFYEHQGIDLTGILRALVRNVESDGYSQGASTITQQLVRGKFLTNEKSLDRKMKEICLSLRFEREHTKEEILEMYLNSIYFGYNCYGIESACDLYWGKSFNDLTLSQLCSLIPIIQSPNNFNPIKNPELNNKKRVRVLNSLFEQELITQEAYTQALNDNSYLDLKINLEGYIKAVTGINSYYIDEVYNQVITDVAKLKDIPRSEAVNFLVNNGCQIYSNYDKRINEILKSHYENKKFAIDDTIQSAISIVNNKGEVVGIYGGYGEKTGNNVLNRAIHSKRHPGSSFKPLFVYAPAMEVLGYTSETILTDRKVTFWTGTQEYTPHNYYSGYKGEMPLRKAISLSVNTIAVDTLNKISIENGYRLAEKSGITTLVENRKGYSDKVLSSALGGLTDGVIPLDMSIAYNTLKTGYRYTPRFYSKVVDEKGNVIIDTAKSDLYTKSKVYKTSTSIYITDTLLDVVKHGTGITAKSNHFVLAGKTGTSNDSKDLWFAGYTPDYSLAVWYGYDNPKEISGNNSQSMHLKLTKSILEEIYKDKPMTNFQFNKDSSADDTFNVRYIQNSELKESLLWDEKAETKMRLRSYNN